MNAPKSAANSELTTRRNFLKTSGVALAGAAIAGIPRAGYTAENNTIKIALVGCGGRGTGAADQALSTAGPTKLWAVADAFERRVQSSLSGLKKPGREEKIAVPAERQFVGLDGYKKAIDSLDKGDVVLLATPPAFRPIHFEYAVKKGVNVFMEKSFAVDAPGIRRVLKTGEMAQQKNVKVATGLMSRHSKPLAEAIDQIHNGTIGDVMTCWAYRMHGPVGFSPKPAGMSELAHQITNYSNYTWLNGSFFVDWLIHNVDVCCWAKNDWPAIAQGMGGRQVRQEPDQLFDHYMAEFSFADGTRFVGQGRHMTKCWDFWGAVIQGTKGCAVIGEGQPKPRIFKGQKQVSENMIWSYKGPGYDAYQAEHDLFFDAIRNDKPYNETERSAKSCFAAILGRMAIESGAALTWEEGLASNIELAPGLDSYTIDSPPPRSSTPDASGKYPVAMPGQEPVV